MADAPNEQLAVQCAAAEVVAGPRVDRRDAELFVVASRQRDEGDRR